MNLLVDLDERFGPDALASALRGIESAGYRAARQHADGDEQLMPWIDEVFGGTWSSEAYAGDSVIAYGQDGHAAFASYAAQDLEFRWLRGVGAEAGVGIFGPFGVAPEHRKRGIGPHLLIAALASLREQGYERALIPAVGEERLVEYYARHSGARIVETFEKSAFFAKSYRTLVLASGSGTNYQAVIDAVKAGRLPLNIAALICNVPDAGILARAKVEGTTAHVIAWDRTNESRAAFDARLFDAAIEVGPELVLLLGWMHLFDDAFVRRFADRTINIHPAFLPFAQQDDEVALSDGTYLPAFRGAHAVREALRAGAGWIGATAHELSIEADRGRVLVRKPMRLPAGADLDGAMTLLRPIEQKVVAGGIMRWVYER
ncbi:MAG: GNAT family N-acetyltransferase [Candidatus Eremiobacteraeota bacterium]|nr:GNAT family N-acetyltransferase [Candidatus Eremiobacteraeota bacterium]